MIELRGAARDPGSRAKIAVKSNDKRIDCRCMCWYAWRTCTSCVFRTWR